MKAILTAMAFIMAATLLVGCGEDREIKEAREEYFEYLVTMHVSFGQEDDGSLGVPEDKIWIDNERYFMVTEEDIPGLIKAIEEHRAIKVVGEPKPTTWFDSGRKRFGGFWFEYERVTDDPPASEEEIAEEKEMYIRFLAERWSRIDREQNRGYIRVVGLADGKITRDHDGDGQEATFPISEKDFPKLIKKIEESRGIRMVGGLTLMIPVEDHDSETDPEMFEFKFEPVE